MITSGTKCHTRRLGQLNEFTWKMGWATGAGTVPGFGANWGFDYLVAGLARVTCATPIAKVSG